MRHRNPLGPRPALALAAAGLFACLSAPRAAAAAAQPDDDTLVWLDNYQDALAQAKETGKPLLVEFRCAP